MGFSVSVNGSLRYGVIVPLGALNRLANELKARELRSAGLPSTAAVIEHGWDCRRGGYAKHGDRVGAIMCDIYLGEAILRWDDGETAWGIAVSDLCAPSAEEIAAYQEAVAAVARAQLENVNAVVVAGCPQPECNGSFAPRPAHEGWPRFENEHGRHMYLFRDEDQQQWFINDRFAPGVDEALVFLDSADGSLPVGQREWSLMAPGDKSEAAGSHDMTVSLEVENQPEAKKRKGARSDVGADANAGTESEHSEDFSCTKCGECFPIKTTPRYRKLRERRSPKEDSSNAVCVACYEGVDDKSKSESEASRKPLADKWSYQRFAPGQIVRIHPRECTG